MHIPYVSIYVGGQWCPSIYIIYISHAYMHLLAIHAMALSNKQERKHHTCKHTVISLIDCPHLLPLPHITFLQDTPFSRLPPEVVEVNLWPLFNKDAKDNMRASSKAWCTAIDIRIRTLEVSEAEHVQRPELVAAGQRWPEITSLGIRIRDGTDPRINKDFLIKNFPHLTPESIKLWVSGLVAYILGGIG